MPLHQGIGTRGVRHTRVWVRNRLGSRALPTDFADQPTELRILWRPVTAIRNSELDDNPDTERDATWQPLDATPMHPEYPCAHCILSSAARVVLESMAGQPMPELTLTSSTAPGVTHRWSNLDDFVQEVANARIWAGFHYRFSTRVGTALGGQVGQYLVKNTMQPVTRTAAR